MFITLFLVATLSDNEPQPTPPPEFIIPSGNTVLKYIELICDYKLSDDNVKEVIKTLEIYKPEATVKDLINMPEQYVTLVKEYLSIFQMNLIEIEKKYGPKVKTAIELISKPLSNLWVAGDFKKAMDLLKSESSFAFLEALGIKMKTIDQAINTLDKIVNNKISINEIMKEYLGVDYKKLYNIVYKEIIENRNLNIYALTDELLEEIRVLFNAPYKLIGFAGETVENIAAPIIQSIISNDFTTNCKKAAESISEQDIKKLPFLGYIKETLEALSNGYFVPPEEPTEQPSSPYWDDDTQNHNNDFNSSNTGFLLLKSIGEKGGLRRFFEIIDRGDQTTIDMMDSVVNKDEKYNFFAKMIQGNLLYQCINLIYSSGIRIRFSDEIINGNRIYLTPLIEEIIENESGGNSTGKELIGKIKTVVIKACKILRLSEEILGKTLFDGISGFIEFIEQANKEFSKDGATLGSLIDGIFVHVSEFIKYMNTAIGSPINNVKSNFIKFYDSIKAIWEKADLDITLDELVQMEFYEFEHRYIEKYGYEFNNATNIVFESLQGEIFSKLNSWTDILSVTTTHNNFSFNFIVEMLEKIGTDIFTKSPLTPAIKMLTRVAENIASKDGDLNEMAKEIFHCDLLRLGSRIFAVADQILMISQVGFNASDFQKNIAAIQEPLSSIKSASTQSAAKGLNITGIVIGVVVTAVVVIAAVVAFILIRKKKNNKDDISDTTNTVLV